MANRVTKTVVYGKAFLRTILAAMKTDPGAALVVGAKLRFSMDPDFNPLATSVIADLEDGEANHTGYTAGGYSLTISDPLNLSASILGVEEQVITAGTDPTPPDPFVGATLTGYWIDDGTNYIAGERWAVEDRVTISAVGDFCALDVAMPLLTVQAAA